jgi:multiple sugar transport system substrate-binding protein
LAGALLALAGFGCSRSDKAGVIRIASFGDTDMMEKTRERLKVLEKEQGMKTDIMYVPYSTYATKLLTLLSAGKAPDVIWVETGLFVPLVHHGALLPLDEFLAKDGQDLKGHYPQIVERFSHGGKAYLVPQDTAPIACVYYNKTMFKAAGIPFPKDNWTWADFLATCKKLVQKDEKGVTRVFAFQDDGGPNWQGIIYANGGTLVDDWRNPKHCTIDLPQNIEAVQFLSDLMNVHHVVPTESERNSFSSQAQDAFTSGRIAMFRSGIWVTPALRKAKNLDWDIVPFPKGPKAKHPGWTTGGSGWGISRDARDREKAWKVARFLANEETQKYNMSTGFAQPSLMALAKTDAFVKNPPPSNKKFLVEAPKFAVYGPDDPNWDEAMISIADPALNAVFRGEAQAAPVLKEITEKINAKYYPKKP